MQKVVLAILFLALTLCVVPAVAQGFELPTTELQLSYIHSLDSGENRTCLTASFKITQVSKFPVNLDVLFAPDFESFGNWGLGISSGLTGPTSSIKVGFGLMGKLDDPVVYVGFKL
jgi:hypothetical protein